MTRREHQIDLLKQLLSVLDDTKEVALVQRMLAKRTDSKVTMCRCSQPAMEYSGSLHECEDCYARGYGK